MNKQSHVIPVATEPVRPLWREGAVWALAAGPLVVVVAGIATAVIAMSAPDPIIGSAKTVAEPAGQPAMQARNKAAELASTPAEVRR